MVPVFTTALMGAVIGALGRGIMPGSDKGGLITTVVLGIGGANLGASLGWENGWWEAGEMIGLGVGAATAVFVLIVYRIFSTIKIGIE